MDSLCHIITGFYILYIGCTFSNDSLLFASPGLVSEQASQREAAEEGRWSAEVGPVLPQHEEIERELQIGQGQHPGGGHGQRCRGVFHRYGAQNLEKVSEIFWYF